MTNEEANAEAAAHYAKYKEKEAKRIAAQATAACSGDASLACIQLAREVDTLRTDYAGLWHDHEQAQTDNESMVVRHAKEIRQARAEALEEAAQVADSHAEHWAQPSFKRDTVAHQRGAEADVIAAAIRRLKEKP